MPLKKIPLVFHPIYSKLSLPGNHRFPIAKYQSLYDEALKIHESKLQIESVVTPIQVEDLTRVHDAEYIQDFLSGQLHEKKMKRIGFPWSQQFVNRTLMAVGGTLKAAQLSIDVGIAINLTGGYHHAHPNFGSGFCVFNDLVVAAERLLADSLVSRVLIFDCDVHQGDGTAVCAKHRPEIFTVSVHCEKNFPSRKQDSDHDLALPKTIRDNEYLQQVASCLDAAINSFKPDLILYDAGVDIHENDELGLLNVTTAGIRERDDLVFSTAKRLGLPVAAVIGGGYQRDIPALTAVHRQLIDSATDIFIH